MLNRNALGRWIIAICLLGVGIATPVQAQAPVLTPADRAAIDTAQTLIVQYGDLAWPGFAEPPGLLLRIDDSELLIGWSDAPTEFSPVTGWDLGGQPVYYTDTPITPGPIASSWPVGERWVAALPVRAEFQAILDDVLGPDVVMLDDETYIRVLVHEMFHAYQLNVWGGAQNLPADLMGPADMAWLADLSAADWDALNVAHAAEGAVLIAALEAETDADARALGAEFVQLRQKRCMSAAAWCAADLVAFERSIEWIEGMARYTELAVALRAAEDGTAGMFQESTVIWEDFLTQLADPGALPGSTRERYAVLGAAQAFLLERLSPGWQTRVLNAGRAVEDVLAEALISDS